jgi:hypothetical protein
VPTTISIQGKRTTATVFCSNLIIVDRKIWYLVAYGPTQEIRAFAQLLMSGDSILETQETTVRNVTSFATLSIIPKLDYGYTGLYIVPPLNSGLVVGDSEEECFDIYSRILDQQQFVLRDWYKAIFELAAEVTPITGKKKCYLTAKDVAYEVRQLIKYGRCSFPEPTASLSVDTHETATKNN